MGKISTVLLLNIVLLCALNCAASERPKIQIVVKLTEPKWCRRIKEEDRTISEFEAEAAKGLVDVLKDRFGFVKFDTSPADLKIEVRIDSDRGGNSTSLVPSHFFMRLVRERPRPPRTEIRWQFRTPSQYNESVTYRGLIAEIVDKMEDRLGEASKPEDFVLKLLTHVSLVAGDSHFFLIKDLGGLPFGVLPWSGDQIRAGLGTELLIRTPTRGLELEHRTRVTRRPADDGEIREIVTGEEVVGNYENGLIVKDHRDTEKSIGDIDTPDRAEVKMAGLHVTFYVPSSSSASHSPRDFD